MALLAFFKHSGPFLCRVSNSPSDRFCEGLKFCKEVYHLLVGNRVLRRCCTSGNSGVWNEIGKHIGKHIGYSNLSFERILDIICKLYAQKFVLTM